VNRAEHYRAMAERYAVTADRTDSVDDRRLLLRMEKSMRALADTEDWLNGVTSPASERHA
jgi:hypothetical protein